MVNINCDYKSIKPPGLAKDKEEEKPDIVREILSLPLVGKESTGPDG